MTQSQEESQKHFIFMSTVLVFSPFPKDYPVFRCTNSKVTVQPSPYLSYRLPKDFVDLSTGEDVHKLIDFLKLVRSSRKKSLTFYLCQMETPKSLDLCFCY